MRSSFSLRSKRFRLEKKKPRSGIFGFDPARNKARAKKWKRGEGEGKEGNAWRQTPRFWKPAFASVGVAKSEEQRMFSQASERSAWLARLVGQYMFNIERSCMVRDKHLPAVVVYSGWFTFQCKSIFFNFFWNSKLFLRLYKGFRSFYLFYKVSASVSFLSSPPRSFTCAIFSHGLWLFAPEPHRNACYAG